MSEMIVQYMYTKHGTSHLFIEMTQVSVCTLDMTCIS